MQPSRIAKRTHRSMLRGPGWKVRCSSEDASAHVAPADRLGDRLVVDAESSPGPVTAEPESAKSRDFGCKPLIKGNLCLSQWELQVGLGRGSNSFRPSPPLQSIRNRFRGLGGGFIFYQG